MIQFRAGRKFYSIPGMGFAAYAPTSPAVVWYLVTGVTPLVAYQAKGAVDFAGSKVNLANPGTSDLADHSTAPTWNVSMGWTFNGSAGLTGGPACNTIKALMVRYANATWSGSHLMISAVSNGGYGCGVGGSWSTASYIWYVQTAPVTKAPAPAGGTLALSGTGAGDSYAYRDGVDEGVSLTGPGTNTRKIAMGGTMFSTFSPSYVGDVLAAVYFGSALSAGQIAALHTAMMAL